MKHSLAPLLLLASTVACGLPSPEQPAGGGGFGAAYGGYGYAVPQVNMDALRKAEQTAYAAVDDSADQQLDGLEKTALSAIRMSLGKEAFSSFQPPPLPASACIAALKKGAVKMKLVAAASGLGGDDFLQLKDEPTERIALLNRTADTNTPAEKHERAEYAKIALKLIDLHRQVSHISGATYTANLNVQSSSVQTMLRVAALVRSRKMYGVELNAEDYALVKRGLERQRRAEAIAASTMVVLAAYQAVLNTGGDARALDYIGEGTLNAFPLRASVSDAEAKSYVDSLGQNVQAVRARYESQMSKTWGDRKYEKDLKLQTDAIFSQAEGAENTQSLSPQAQAQIYAAAAARNRAADANANAAARNASSASSANAASGWSGVTRVPPGAGPTIPRNAKNALDTVSAAVNGDASRTLDGVAGMFPGDTTIGASLQGIAALKNGDPRGAINAALTLVPIPGLKDIFGIASKLLFKD